MFSKKIHYIPPKDSIQNTEYSIQIKVKIKNSLKLNSESRIMSTDFHISILTFYFKKSRIFYIILTAVHKIQDTGYRIQDTGYRIQNTEYRIQDTGYRIQDTEYRIQDTGYRIQNTEYRIQDTV